MHGKRGERFVYLTWGDLADGDFAMFRRAKLMLSRVDPALVADAAGVGRSLVADVVLTDEKGGPRCAPGRPARGALERRGGLSRQLSGGRSL